MPGERILGPLFGRAYPWRAPSLDSNPGVPIMARPSLLMACPEAIEGLSAGCVLAPRPDTGIRRVAELGGWLNFDIGVNRNDCTHQRPMQVGQW